MAQDITLPIEDGFVNLRVGAIIQKGGKLLLVGNAKNDYDYSVGGRIRFGETAEEAVVREVREETGRALAIDRLGFVHENYFYGDIPGVNRDRLIYEVSFYFYMKVPEDFEPVGESATDEGRVRETMQWVSPDDPRTIYPEFYRTELRRPEMTVKHFVTDERGAGA